MKLSEETTLSYEECFLCDELTGRAGEGEDSLYCDECDKGPYCPGCFRKHHESDEKVAQLEEEKESLRGFVAIVLCWRPEWAQTSYFQKLPDELRNDLVELAKSTKHEGPGGIDDKWLDALLTKEQSNVR